MLKRPPPPPLYPKCQAWHEMRISYRGNSANLIILFLLNLQAARGTYIRHWHVLEDVQQPVRIQWLSKLVQLSEPNGVGGSNEEE